MKDTVLGTAETAQAETRDYRKSCNCSGDFLYIHHIIFNNIKDEVTFYKFFISSSSTVQAVETRDNRKSSNCSGDFLYILHIIFNRIKDKVTFYTFFISSSTTLRMK